jgi:hypothetical protein
MSTNPDQAGETRPSDRSNWAQPVSKLKVSSMPAEAMNFSVEGRRVVGPLQGFGQLWQKAYSVRRKGASITPAEVIRTWKEDFTKFWPAGNRFYAPRTLTSMDKSA